MAWSDEPTYAQINVIFSWLESEIGREEAKKATSWLENTATRHDVSVEMSRLKELRDKGLLDASKCFTSEIWEGFNHD